MAGVWSRENRMNQFRKGKQTTFRICGMVSPWAYSHTDSLIMSWSLVCIRGGNSHKENLLRCLSRVTGNCHARFLGGESGRKPRDLPDYR